MQALSFLAVVVLGYLMGSFPTGYLAARLMKGIDPRRHGGFLLPAVSDLSWVAPRGLSSPRPIGTRAILFYMPGEEKITHDQECTSPESISVAGC